MASHLHWADYLILVGFLVISLAIGIYHSLTGGRQKTVAEFIMANRRLKVIPTSISLLVSIVSALLLLNTTAETYSYGIQQIFFFILALPVALVFVERIIVPWLYPLKLTSVYDYFEKRYMSKTIRIFGAALGIIMSVLNMGVAMYAPSAALESATGFPLAVSIPSMAVVTVTYTALGGMRAVIWTDVFQFLIMLVGMIAILVKGLIVVGGISNVFRLAEEEGRLVWANFSIDPRERNTVWSLIVGVSITWIHHFGLSQSAVQRYSAVDRLSKARRTILLVIPPFIIMDIVAGVIALIVLAYYSSIRCDPLANKDIANTNMMLPHFVVTIFADSPGFAGVFLATLYGGTLSTLSSWLSGSAANCWEDMLKWKLNHLQETTKTLINKLLVVLFGFLITGVAFLSAAIPGPIIQVLVGLYSSVIGPLIGFFVLGAVSKHANWKGTILGGIVGVLLTFWLSVGSMLTHHKHPPLPPLSVKQCSHDNKNSTFLTYTLNYDNYTYSEAIDGIWINNNRNQTTEVMPDAATHTQLQGLENFYAISYLWFIPIGIIVTGVVGIIASLIMRDRDLEAKVDERLLLRFHRCGCSKENEILEHMEDGNKGSIHLEDGNKGSIHLEDENKKSIHLEDGNKESIHMEDGNKGSMQGTKVCAT